MRFASREAEQGFEVAAGGATSEAAKAALSILRGLTISLALEGVHPRPCVLTWRLLLRAATLVVNNKKMDK